MNIIPGRGIGELRFGLTRDQAIARLGHPDKVYTTEFRCVRTQYNALRLELSFEPDNDARFGWFESQNPDTTLCGVAVIGQPVEQVLAGVAGQLGKPDEKDDYGGMTSYGFSELWLELQVAFGAVQTVCAGVLYADDDTPQWPDS